jgi:hypothetical protein
MSQRGNRIRTNKPIAQAADSTVCAENSCAAIPPAIAGDGKYTNSKGTTKKPMVDRLISHAAASQRGNARNTGGSQR